MSKKSCLAAIALAALAVPSSADANGRYPQTVEVRFQPGNSQRILVGATFGLLLSEDNGASWRWTCEQNIGYMGTFDPVYAVSTPGTIFGTTFNGLSITRDNGCTWAFAGDGLAGHWASDVQIGADGAVWVTTTSGGKPNDVFVSHDDGKTFASTGMLHELAWWKSVRVAPTDAQRVYVSGYQIAAAGGDGDAGSAPMPLLYRSDNGGEDWTQLAFSFGQESQFFLLDVSPVDPDVVFGRVNGPLKDTLLRSDNGGVSWKEVLAFDGDGADITGFVLAPDGKRVIAGTINFGVKISENGGDTWADPTMKVKMACAGQRPSDGALFTCGANWNPDKMALGRSTDGGETWEKQMRFVELDDELSCPAGSGHAVKCAGLWEGIATQFGIGAADAGPMTVDATPGPDDGGDKPTSKPDCGCSLAFASVLLAAPWPRRRRRSAR